jgi:hypothetical protein
MTASTWPGATVAPGSTASRPNVPSAGELRVATARAVTVAGASTTSVTSPRPAVPSPTSSESSEQDAAVTSSTAIIMKAATTDGGRRTRAMVVRPT